MADITEYPEIPSEEYQRGWHDGMADAIAAANEDSAQLETYRTLIVALENEVAKLKEAGHAN